MQHPLFLTLAAMPRLYKRNNLTRMKVLRNNNVVGTCHGMSDLAVYDRLNHAYWGLTCHGMSLQVGEFQFCNTLYFCGIFATGIGGSGRGWGSRSL